MPSYRLLRSNKESGPYSLNDLLTLGLKPYDLIWVEGRSAAWRYSSEVSELKEYAPAVEEQPFDRFFKKPSETEPVMKETSVAPHIEISFQPKTVNENPAKAEPVLNGISLEEELPKVKKITPEVPNISSSSYQSQPKKGVCFNA